MSNDALRIAMRRLMRAALPADKREGVTVPPEDLRAVLQLVKRLKNRTPADGCVVCRHKDREHVQEGCRACDNEGAVCVGFVPIADVPFDLPARPAPATCMECGGSGSVERLSDVPGFVIEHIPCPACQ